MQTWNLYCDRCHKSWIEILHGSSVTCECGHVFTVGYIDTGVARSAYVAAHQADIAARRVAKPGIALGHDSVPRAGD